MKWVIADVLFVPALVLLMVGAAEFIETFGATLLIVIVGAVFMGVLSWHSR
jgi:hypothetical protein